MKLRLIGLSLLLINFSCSKESVEIEEEPIEEIPVCVFDQVLDNSRGACSDTLTFTPSYTELISGSTRIITTNSIPNHAVGIFGGGAGSLNPNAISSFICVFVSR